MVALMKNVIINTSRPTYSVATGTSTPLPYLRSIQGHIEPVHAQDYQMLPAAALQSKYKLKVDVDVDIVEGDTITSFTRITDGSAWFNNANTIFTVSYVEPSSPGLLDCNMCYVNVDVIGGPAGR